MPSKSAKQRRFMAAAANNPDFAKRAGIKQSVAREFHRADYPRRKKMQFGGNVGGLSQAAKRMFQPGGGFVPAGATRNEQGLIEFGGYNPRNQFPGGSQPRGGLARLFSGRAPAGGGQPSGFLARLMQQRQGGPGGPIDTQGRGGFNWRNPMPPGMAQPGGPGGPMPGGKQFPGRRIAPPPGKGPIQGGLGQYRRAGGFRGAGRPLQQPPGVQGRIMGRTPAGGGVNPLLRTTGAASQRYGQALNRMRGAPGAAAGLGRRFAGGGRVSKKSNA